VILISTNINSNVISNKEPEIKLTEISNELAEKIILDKLEQLDKTDFSINKEKTQIITNETGKLLAYYFQLDPHGFMIISGYYELPAIIAYSFTSPNKITSDVKDLFLSIVTTDLSLRLQNINYISEEIIEKHRSDIQQIIHDEKTNSLFDQWPPAGSTPTEGWVLTTWHQNDPYNRFCPIDLPSEQRSVAGCPSITMAQILNYHQTINNVSFTDDDDYYHNYGGNSYWIDDDYLTYDFPSFPQLNSYLNTLADHYANNITLTNEDKAALTFACGVAATQVYNPSGSGTFGVNQVYDAYLKFNITSIELLDENDPDIYQHLSDNMKNASPAHLAIVNEEWTSGHNLVVDGYNTENYYHLNFGWGGPYDGWYVLPDDLPFDLTVIEGIILDISIDNNSIDVEQTHHDRGFPIRHAVDGDWAGAQDFLPTLNTISKAEIYLRKFGTPEFNLTVELRESGIEESLIDTIVFTPDEISSSWTWLDLDFNDTPVTSGMQYFIVCPPAPSGVTTSFGYEWGYAFGNQYDDGSFWFTRNGGGLWRDLPNMYEFVFRTYGYT